MKILYVITALGVGGAENLLADVCQRLTGRHSVTVVYLRPKTDYLTRIEGTGARTVFVDLAGLGVFRTLAALRRIIRQTEPDIVHTHLPAADTLGRLAALTCRGVPVISTIHNEDLWKRRNTPGSLLLRGFNRFTVNRFRRSRLIAVSGSVKAACLRLEGIRPEKITVLYNFIDLDNPAKSRQGFVPPLPEGGFTLLTAARMEPNKGHLLLLKAVRLLADGNRVPGLRAALLGQGSQEAALRAYAAEEGLADRVFFLGVQPNVYDYLRAADVMVLPSQNEGQSIAVLEAFYCGTLVLASRIAANAELLAEGQNGVLFDLEGGPAGLADAIQTVYENRATYGSLRENARAHCLSLTAERHMEGLLSLYRAAVGKDGG